MSILDIDFDQDSESLPAIAQLVKYVDGKARLAFDNDPDELETEDADDEHKFGKRPNSLYIHYVTLTNSGRLAARHYWCHKKVNDPNWRHDDDQSGSHVSDGIRPREVNRIVEQVLTGTYQTVGHVEQVKPTGTILDVSWRWISWVVVVFDHQAWKFVRDGIGFQTYGADDSFHYRKKFTVDLGKSYKPTAMKMTNYMRQNGSDLPIGSGVNQSYKFDLILSVRLEGGGRVLVKIDPTGTNNGPTGGGAPP